MKWKKSFVGISIVLAVVAFSAFNEKDKNPADLATEYYHNSLDSFVAQADRFSQTLAKFESGDITASGIHQNFAELRRAFKNTETLFAYIDPEFVKDFINGAPLPRLDRASANLIEISPQGLQRMGELVFDDLKNKQIFEELNQLSRSLENDLAEAISFQKSVVLTDRIVLEAARLELVRILTLGITGFDNPSGDFALEEAVVTLRSCERLIRPYLTEVNKELANETQYAFDRGQYFLETQTDFGRFDRLAFLREVINTLYKNIRDIHIELQIETISEISDIAQPLNFSSDNIFADDFLNRAYFGGFLRTEKLREMENLGRLLFFDPILSSNNQRACASCHNPKKGFADGLEKSIATNPADTVFRNAPTLINAVYAKSYFYDLRADKLTNQLEHVVFSHGEFNTDFQAIFKKLEASDTYLGLFNEAYPFLETGKISQHAISTSIAAYVSSLSSFDSSFDKYVRGEFENIDTRVYQGFNLFMGKAACGTCHFAPVFSGLLPPDFQDSESEVLGVPLMSGDSGMVVLDTDPGRAGSKRPADAHWIFENSFKTVSVRNAALTAPYMHNGIFKDLHAVVNFYEKGGGIGHGIDVKNQTLPSEPLLLTDHEKDCLVAFMEALSDTSSLGAIPKNLPQFDNHPEWNARIIGGSY